MTPISSYSSNDKLRLLLQGPSGSGKTTVASQFPNSYIIDVDVNLGGTLRFLKERNMTLPVGFDVLDKDESGADVPIAMRYQRLAKLLIEAQTNDAVESIVIDSGTTLAPVFIAEVCRQQGKANIQSFKDGRQFWGFFAPLAQHFMATLSVMRKHVVLIVHEKTNKSETGAIMLPYKVAWPGQVGENIGVFFTNVWRCECKQTPSGTHINYEWNIRTAPDQRFELKNTLGLPAVFPFNWKLIEEKLK